MIQITREAAQKLQNFITHLGIISHADLAKVKEYSDLLNAAIDASLSTPQTPAAYGAQNVRNGKWGYIWHTHDDVKGWIRLQHQSDDCITYRGPVALFTATTQPPAHTPSTPMMYQISKTREIYRGYTDVQSALDYLEARIANTGANK